MAEKTILRTFNYRHEAESVRAYLDAHGIECAVISDDCGAVDPALSLVRGTHLVVAPENVEPAEALLGMIDKAPAQDE
jgi:hypothetical protein